MSDWVALLSVRQVPPLPQVQPAVGTIICKYGYVQTQCAAGHMYTPTESQISRSSTPDGWPNSSFY